MMDPATAAALAKIAAGLFSDTDRLIKILLGILLFVLFVFIFFFSAPMVLHQHVPVVTVDIAEMYVNAAEAVSDSTKSPADPDGVTVNWQYVIAIDAVRFNQDFSKASPSEAYRIAKMFVRQIGTHKVGSGDSEKSYPVYQLVSLDDVVAQLGLNLGKVNQYLQYDLSFLVQGDGVAQVGGRIYTAPEALKYQDVNAGAIISYLQHYHSALANTEDVQIIISAAKAHGLNPLLLFAITGQEQCFDDIDHDTAANVSRIAQNPFNVGGSWQTSNYNLAQSADICANFLAERLSQAPPDGENAVQWINDPDNHNGGLYASTAIGSPTPGWWEGVNCFFQQMNSEPGIYVSSGQK